MLICKHGNYDVMCYQCDQEFEFREEEEEPTIFTLKIVKTSASERRSNKRIRIFALTYEDNKIDRFNFLVDKIRDAFPQAEGITEFNYSQNQEFINPPKDSIFDGFEVGEE